MTEAQPNTLKMFEDRAAPPLEAECEALAGEGGACPPDAKAGSAGPWLFAVTLIAVIVFFWWLTIYSHGVAPHSS